MDKLKPILFNGEMVRAILDGRKSVTRRLIKPQPTGRVYHYTGHDVNYWVEENETSTASYISKLLMPYQPGDILYVRETWCDPTPDQSGWPVLYKADMPMHWDAKDVEFGKDVTLKAEDFKWRPSIHMPKEAARLFLKVKAVSAQRLQDFLCCRDEIIKEGIFFDTYAAAAESFKTLWDSTVKQEDISDLGFDANPWVWAIEFERCEKPEE